MDGDTIGGEESFVEVKVAMDHEEKKSFMSRPGLNEEGVSRFVLPSGGDMDVIVYGRIAHEVDEILFEEKLPSMMKMSNEDGTLEAPIKGCMTTILDGSHDQIRDDIRQGIMRTEETIIGKPDSILVADFWVEETQRGYRASFRDVKFTKVKNDFNRMDIVLTNRFFFEAQDIVFTPYKRDENGCVSVALSEETEERLKRKVLNG